MRSPFFKSLMEIIRINC